MPAAIPRAAGRNRKCHERWLVAFKIRETVSPELPRAPSLELSVLPSGGGQNFRWRELCRYVVAAGRVTRALCCNGADRDRTGDLCSAIAALSQLSYSPAVSRRCGGSPEADRRTMEKAPRFHGAAPD